MDQDDISEPLMAACEAMLSEVGGQAIDRERLLSAMPVIQTMVAAVRAMDELDLGMVEPMTAFRPLP